MSNTNYIGAIVKILEPPKKEFISNSILITKFRAQLSTIRQMRVVELISWGNLASDLSNYYNVYDYILIEGFLSLRDSSNLLSNKQLSKKVQITVSKVYPFLLN